MNSVYILHSRGHLQRNTCPIISFFFSPSPNSLHPFSSKLLVPSVKMKIKIKEYNLYRTQRKEGTAYLSVMCLPVLCLFTLTTFQHGKRDEHSEMLREAGGLLSF